MRRYEKMRCVGKRMEARVVTVVTCEAIPLLPWLLCLELIAELVWKKLEKGSQGNHSGNHLSISKPNKKRKTKNMQFMQCNNATTKKLLRRLFLAERDVFEATADQDIFLCQSVTMPIQQNPSITYKIAWFQLQVLCFVGNVNVDWM